MRSMTGFGQASRSTEEMDLVVEIKTVNSRYLDLNLRVPRELNSLEQQLRKEIIFPLPRKSAPWVGRANWTFPLSCSSPEYSHHVR
jgi:uncharacterized protein (TIGR00255 family)